MHSSYYMKAIIYSIEDFQKPQLIESLVSCYRSARIRSIYNFDKNTESNSSASHAQNMPLHLSLSRKDL